MRTVRMVAALALVVGFAGCDDGPQADVPAFEERWASIVDIVPPKPSDASFASATCKATLASLREARVGLRPPKDDKLVSDVVDLWVETAQSTFFQCLQDEDLLAAYEELDRIESTVDRLLAET